MSHSIATPKGAVTIRPAVPGDAAPLRALRLEALAGHPAAFAADVALTAAGSAEEWAARIAEYASEEMGVTCVAEAEGRLIGMAGLVRGHWPKTRHGATLWGVYVRADWRGLHLAEALVEACIAWARAQGVAMVKLGVVTINTPAIRCYARCGFAAYGLDPKVLCLDGIFYDELLMVRPV